jgi:hypothetical protein
LSERSDELGDSPEKLPRRGLGETLRTLDAEQRLAAIAAAVLVGSLFLPWWRDPVFDISYVAVRRLSFIELALAIVAIAVLFLVIRRAEGRFFHLPLSDGTLIATAGVWSVLLVIVRIIDGPTRTVGNVTRDYELRWGALIALGAAVTLAVAGIQERRSRHPGEPEAVAADADATPTLPLAH